MPPEVLERLVFTHLGRENPDLILGPGIGQDASLIRFGDKILVASTDPITGSIEDIGWLAVHINANDVATFGVQPKWFLTSIMLPPGSTESEVGRIMEQIDNAANDLGIAVAGGHTEITKGLDRPIVAGFMLGETIEGGYVTSSGAQPGDDIIMTKTAAIEGTAILAAEGASVLTKRLGASIIEEARRIRNQISVVKEGVTAFQTGYLTAMHDPTEGGLTGGIHELCDASRVGFEIDIDMVPIHPATKIICNELDVNIMELISSGCMVMTCKSGHSENVIKAINSKGIEAKVLGTIVEDSAIRIGISEGQISELSCPSTDALWSALIKLDAL